MTLWLSETDSADAPASPCHQRTELRMRVFDLVLALPLMLLVAVPTAALLRYRASAPMRGRQDRLFKLQYLALPPGLASRALRLLGARHWPTLVNVIRGDMGWVGPRPRSASEAVPAGSAIVRPGLVDPWFIRTRMGVDFIGAELAERHYLARRGLRHDAGILMRAPFAALLPAQPAHPAPTVRVGGTEVDNVTMNEALCAITSMLEGARSGHVCFVNAACVNAAARDMAYLRAVRAAQLCLPDGIGMRIGSLLLGRPLKQNVNGTDLFPRLMDALQERSARIYLLGGRPGVAAAAAAEVTSRWPGLQVVGHHAGYFQAEQDATVAARVRGSGADVVLVGMGVPRQDVFIHEQLSRLGVKVAMGVGGLFDFISGRIERAPLWMRESGLEWVWRLMQEPARLWRRYLLGNVSFLARVLAQRLGRAGLDRTRRKPVQRNPGGQRRAGHVPAHLGARSRARRTLRAGPVGPAPRQVSRVSRLDS